MGNSLKVATIGGIQILVSWTWLLAFAIVTWSLGVYYSNTFPGWGGGTAYLVAAVSAILLFVTVLLHELAHSFTARALGLPVKTIYLFIFGGVSNLTQEPQTPRIEFQIAVAGPLTSLILAGIFYALHAAIGNGSSELTAVLGYLASINLLLAIFNLIPGFPLDGGRVFRSIVWAITGSMGRATRIATRVGKSWATSLSSSAWLRPSCLASWGAASGSPSSAGSCTTPPAPVGSR
jgi:Zn-dependent protease